MRLLHPAKLGVRHKTGRIARFKSPQEVEPHFVLEQTQQLLHNFSALVPKSLDADATIQSARFYMRHRQMCAERHRKYGFWHSRLIDRGFADLNDNEKRIVFTERGNHAPWAAARLFRTCRALEQVGIVLVFLDEVSEVFDAVVRECHDDVATWSGHPPGPFRWATSHNQSSSSPSISATRAIVWTR